MSFWFAYVLASSYVVCAALVLWLSIKVIEKILGCYHLEAIVVLSAVLVVLSMIALLAMGIRDNYNAKHPQPVEEVR
jgi:hypothetical protein